MCHVMVRTLTVLILSLTIVPVAHAQMWPGVEQPQLEQKLPTHVAVYCATEPIAGAAGWTWLEAPEIYLGPETCDQLSRGVYAGAYLALYHEWWHQAFHETNERLTQEGAVSIFRYVLRHYWGFDEAKAQVYYQALWQIGFTGAYRIDWPSNKLDPLRSF